MLVRLSLQLGQEFPLRRLLPALFLILLPACAQQTPQRAVAAAQEMAATVRAAWPAGVITTTRHPGEWNYEEGVLLDGMAAEGQLSGDTRDFDYIKAAIDRYVGPDGVIHNDAAGAPFPSQLEALDDIEMGRAVLLCYSRTKDVRYKKAAEFLIGRLALQKRGASGGYWHKLAYPNQMWLDGAYMAEPFRAEYAATFGQPAMFTDIATQILLMSRRMRDGRTGLLYHGWDESKTAAWADKQTGLSGTLWARADGWYAVALVDTLDWLPADLPERLALLADLRQTLAAIAAVQDPNTGLWWQVLDRPAAKGNFPEASASAMFVYALAKAVRLGYVPREPFGTEARRGWQGIQDRFVKSAGPWRVTLTGTVGAAGLGGTPYRPGTYEYYVGEPVQDNDAKGVGAYLLAAAEIGRMK